MDEYDDGRRPPGKNDLTPLNVKKIPKRQAAVAIKDGSDRGDLPVITAAGWGKIAEQILALAYENDIKVREDSALAEMLTKIDVDSPIPSEAFMAVAEVLSMVYRANGQPNPFDAVFEDAMKDLHEE